MAIGPETYLKEKEQVSTEYLLTSKINGVYVVRSLRDLFVYLLAFITKVLNYPPHQILKYVFKYVFPVLLFFVLLPTPVAAAPQIVSGVPSTVGVDQSFNVTIKLTVGGKAGSIYYLRGAFFDPQSTATNKYFGYTKNRSNEWYKGGSGHTRYFQTLPLNEFNTWEGVIEVKPDSLSSIYKGSGTYNFIVGYYTESGSGPDWSGPVQIAITGSSASPTPTPSPSPSPSPTPDTSPSPSPSPKPSPTPIKSGPTPSPKVLGTTKTATPSPSPKLSPTPKEDKLVLGQTTVSPSPQEKSSGGFAGVNLLALGLIGLGLVLIAFSAYTFLKPRSSDTITIDS